ncbi:hypothetical protein AMJ71_11160, partial [candidate division TA06 bacterium SM1_40]
PARHIGIRAEEQLLACRSIYLAHLSRYPAGTRTPIIETAPGPVKRMIMIATRMTKAQSPRASRAVPAIPYVRGHVGTDRDLSASIPL